jgi:asparagine synthase (glutamine-hydrolysing)
MKTMDIINGDFAFVWTNGKQIMAARDPVGVRLSFTRYMQRIPSLLRVRSKALLFLGSQIHVFPPGHIYDSHVNDFVCYHNWVLVKINKYFNMDSHFKNFATLSNKLCMSVFDDTNVK